MPNLNINNPDKELFSRVGKNLESAQTIKRPSMSYMQDAMRRLKKNKAAMISFWILAFLIFMSIIGPIISHSLFGHTYDRQDLNVANQSTIMNNKRGIALISKGPIQYKDYKYNFRKTKITMSGVEVFGAGILSFRIGNEADKSWQGDMKEYTLSADIDGWEDLDDIVQKLNDASEELLKEDSNFRGVSFTRKGSTITVKSKGKTWFNSRYWFGTDQFGRDLWTRLWEGGRLSFLIAFVSVFVTVFFGIVYGGISGYIGGRIDNFMMRFIEIMMTVPDLLYIILLMTVMDPGITPIIIVLTATSWMGTARLVRGEVLRLKHSEYVIAAQALGASGNRIIFRHLIPNTMGPILVNMTMMIPRMIFAEAFLSFIGLGVPVPFASWGVLANLGATAFRHFPNQLLVPAVAISLTMLGFNLLGDGLRDALDPRLRK